CVGVRDEVLGVVCRVYPGMALGALSSWRHTLQYEVRNGLWVYVRRRDIRRDKLLLLGVRQPGSLRVRAQIRRSLRTFQESRPKNSCLCFFEDIKFMQENSDLVYSVCHQEQAAPPKINK